MIWITFSNMLATCVIAYFAYTSYRITKELKKSSESQREETNNLFKAIVISNLLSGNSDLQMTFNKFKEYYKEKTTIF